MRLNKSHVSDDFTIFPQYICISRSYFPHQSTKLLHKHRNYGEKDKQLNKRDQLLVLLLIEHFDGKDLDVIGRIRDKTIRLHTARLLLHTLHHLQMNGNMMVKYTSYKVLDQH